MAHASRSSTKLCGAYVSAPFESLFHSHSLAFWRFCRLEEQAYVCFYIFIS